MMIHKTQYINENTLKSLICVLFLFMPQMLIAKTTQPQLSTPSLSKEEISRRVMMGIQMQQNMKKTESLNKVAEQRFKIMNMENELISLEKEKNNSDILKNPAKIARVFQQKNKLERQIKREKKILSDLENESSKVH